MGQKTESHQKASSSSMNSKHIATMKFIPCKVKDETNNPFQWSVYMSNIMPAINGQVLINPFQPGCHIKSKWQNSVSDKQCRLVDIIGSLRGYDGNCDENVTSKLTFALS